jgi:hypothetical protein
VADKQTISIKPDQAQLAGFYAAVKRLDKDANTKLKTDVMAISAWSAGRIKESASRNPYPDQAAKALATTRAVRDRVPNIVIGGSRQKYSGGAVSGQVLFGSEFGANPTSVNGAFPNGGRRFPFRTPKLGRGNEGYGIFPTLRQIQPEITRQWKYAVDKVLRQWSKG